MRVHLCICKMFLYCYGHTMIGLFTLLRFLMNEFSSRREARDKVSESIISLPGMFSIDSLYLLSAILMCMSRFLIDWNGLLCIKGRGFANFRCSFGILVDFHPLICGSFVQSVQRYNCFVSSC